MLSHGDAYIKNKSSRPCLRPAAFLSSDAQLPYDSADAQAIILYRNMLLFICNAVCTTIPGSAEFVLSFPGPAGSTKFRPSVWNIHFWS